MKVQQPTAARSSSLSIISMKTNFLLIASFSGLAIHLVNAAPIDSQVADANAATEKDYLPGLGGAYGPPGVYGPGAYGPIGEDSRRVRSNILYTDIRDVGAAGRIVGGAVNTAANGKTSHHLSILWNSLRIPEYSRRRRSSDC